MSLWGVSKTLREQFGIELPAGVSERQAALIQDAIGAAGYVLADEDGMLDAEDGAYEAEVRRRVGEIVGVAL